jgi:predicted Zn-dependent peptidase
MKVKNKILPNGLRLITANIEGLESVTALVLTAVGSRYEPKERLGISHVLEHMTFKGTKNRPNPGDISRAIEEVGGDSNAFTSKEFTGYFIRLSADKTDVALDILSDILLYPIFDPKELKKEEGVVLEERKKDIDIPSRHIFDMIEEQVFGDQPLGWSIIGTPRSVRSIKQPDLFDFVSKYYRPQNMVVVVAGKVSRDIETQVQKYFGALTAKEAPGYEAALVKQSAPRVQIDKRKFEQANLALAVEGVNRSDQDYYPLMVLNSVLGEGMSSRLFQSVREKRGLAYTVRSGADSYHDTGIFVIYAGVGLSKVEEAITAILEELTRLTKEKIPAAEIKKGKEVLKGRLKLSMESTLNVAEEFGLRELLEKRVLTVEEIINLIDRVTADDIFRVATRVFKTERLNLSLIGPFEDETRFLKLLKV